MTRLSEPDLKKETMAEGSEELFVQRIVALWGFNEAAFGGILHALQIPFAGLFIGSVAVLLITLIAHFSKDKLAILKATIIVMLVKGIISPYTPLTAYIAVFIEGMLGYIIFSLVRYEPAASIMLGFTALVYSSLQKLIVTTIFFGMQFWKSIDLFAQYVFNQFGIHAQARTLSISLVLIIIYVALHMMAGLYAGFKAYKIPGRLNDEKILKLKSEYISSAGEESGLMKKKGGRRHWWKKPSRIFLSFFILAVFLLTYFFPQSGKNHSSEIIIMIIRAVGIMLVWSLLLASPLKKLLRRIIEKNKFKHAAEIERITQLFPSFGKVINYTWKKSSSAKGIGRMKKFLTESILLLLIIDM